MASMLKFLECSKCHQLIMEDSNFKTHFGEDGSILCDACYKEEQKDDRAGQHSKEDEQ